jgi:selenocysteine lyase/cysteine desulfurase
LEKILCPIREGGTGSVSENDRQPDFMPDRYESGSHNAIGIIGLLEGVKWVAHKTVEALHAHDRELVATFIEGLGDIQGLKLYGPQGVMHRTSVFSVSIDGFEPYELAGVLESTYGILTRPGLHCAPMVHQALGTLARGGTTRFSFGPFLAMPDVQYAADALAEIALSRNTASFR